MLRQKISEIGTSQGKYDGRLNGRDRGRPGFSGEQGHLTNRGAFRELGDKKINACRGIFLANLDQAGLDDVHRHARRPFANNDFSRRKFSGFQAGSEFGQAVGTEFCEEFDVL